MFQCSCTGLKVCLTGVWTGFIIWYFLCPSLGFIKAQVWLDNSCEWQIASSRCCPPMGPFLGNMGRPLQQTLVGLESFPTSLGQPGCTAPSPLQASKEGGRLASSLVRQPAQAHCVPFCSPVPILEVEITTDTNFIINHLVWGSSLPSVNWPHPFLRGWVLKAEERLAALKVVIHQRWWERKLETLKYGEGSIPGGCCSKAKQRAWATGRVWMFVLLTASVSNLVPRAES